MKPERRISRLRSDTLAAAVVAVLALAGTAEAARKRVVVMPFDGPGAQTLENGVTGVLKESHAVIAYEVFEKALAALHVRPNSDENIGRAARQVGADAVIAGKVKKVAGEWELQLSIRNGADGSVLEEMSIPLPKPGEKDERLRQRVAQDLGAALSHAERGSSDEGAPASRKAARGEEAESEKQAAEPRGKAKREEAEPEPEEKAPPKRPVAAKKDESEKSDKSDKSEKADKGKGKKPAKDEPEAEKAVDVEEVKEVKRRNEPEGPGFFESAWAAAKVGNRFVDAWLGFTLVSHSLSYDNADLQTHASGVSPGFVVGFEAFPVPLLKLGIARLDNIGVGGGFAIEPFSKHDNGMGTAPVVQRRFHFDLRYAFRLSDHTMVIPTLGMGQYFFSVRDKDFIDPSKCTLMRPMMIKPVCIASAIETYVSLGAVGKLAFGPNATGHLRLDLMPVLSVNTDPGQIAAEAGDFAFGIGSEIGYTYQFMPFLAARASFEFTHFFHVLNPPDDGMGKAYSSAGQTYLGWMLAGVYRF